VFLAHVFEAASLLVVKSESLVICGLDEVTLILSYRACSIL
jgi:hypothetical protein